MIIALVGNQNCGKTTLFNALTGSNQHVGNFPGVTVDGKIGTLINYDKVEICDLPGIYSLSPYSNEEIVTRDFIIKNKPDVVLNIVDATNIERNLYLTLQLCELNVPVIMALNMMDEVESSGNSIDIEKLSELLGISVCAISASKNEGITELVKETLEVAKSKKKPAVVDICKPTSPVHRAIHGMMHLISDHAAGEDLPLRYVATHLIEGDAILEDSLNLTDNEKDIINHVVTEMEKDEGQDREVCLAKMRYDFIDHISLNCVKRVNVLTFTQQRSNKIDKILTDKYLAFPIFIIIMGLIFYLTFGLIGKFLSDGFEKLIELFINLVNKGLVNYGINEVVRSLIVDGILTGVGSVLSFLPTIVVLFLFLSLLEDSGYMARVAFIMDKPLRKLGLSGRSFVPLLIGFGCSVPAIMASRTLTSQRDKKITLMLIPFIPCSAKLPIFTVLCAAFFGVNSVLVMIGLYIFSVLMGIIVAFITKLVAKGKPSPFMMELPAYRMPSFKTTLILMWEKAKDFLRKAFTVIFVATVIIWFLQSFDLKLNYVSENNDSILALVSKFITPIFKPIGITRWEVCASLISGLSAKEAVVSTLSVLLGTVHIESILTTLQGISLLVFVLLYMPCVATFAVLKKELKNTPLAILYMAGQTLFAYLIAFIIYNIGVLL